MAPKAKPPAERFWAKVQKKSGDGCWIWSAGQNAHCRGVFSLRSGKTVQVHRYAWELSRGEPAPKDVWRSCHNGLCVRPDHLTTEMPEKYREARRQAYHTRVIAKKASKQAVDRKQMIRQLQEKRKKGAP